MFWGYRRKEVGGSGLAPTLARSRSQRGLFAAPVAAQLHQILIKAGAYRKLSALLLFWGYRRKEVGGSGLAPTLARSMAQRGLFAALVAAQLHQILIKAGAYRKLSALLLFWQK
ncbi:MAG: hypothetical protein A2251_01245 [Elusimicrobia bacterium RIFOXYA2_FULL_47_53]|nr:MAG: hypothetical protein A2251_01245 [Elusimicrobia bacterium RIFOXYA2_FULL_47_53]OGS31379.1 MAG: hypothetical protein A2323_09535 [Elusimicrobia bacterium RIFOXYB2_FULL_46_23]